MKDVDVLARTIFGEARGETVSGSGCFRGYEQAGFFPPPRTLLVGKFGCRHLSKSPTVFLLE